MSGSNPITVPFVLPPNTVWGRLGIASGPGQAIPFSVILDELVDTNWTASGQDLHYALTGNVGIGIASPTAKLHVKDAASQASVLIDGSATGNPFVGFAQAGTTKAFIQYVDSGDYFQVYNGGSSLQVYSPTDVRFPGTTKKEIGLDSNGKLVKANNVKNALLYGADNTGSTEIGLIFNQMVTDLLADSPKGGILYFPAGRYNCNGSEAPLVAFTNPTNVSTECSITLKGDGQGATQFISSNTGRAAIQARMKDVRHTFHAEGCTFMATGAAALVGLYIYMDENGSFADFQRNTVSNCSFVAKNENSSGSYWTYGLQFNNACGNSIRDCVFSGVPGDLTLGTGIRLVGEGTNSRISIYTDVTQCHFGSLAVGILYDTEVQGLSVSQCNFQPLGSGITVASGSDQNQLTVTSSQFDCRKNPAIYMLDGVQAQVTNSLFILGDTGLGGNANNQIAIDLGPSIYNAVNGCIFNIVGGTGHSGIRSTGQHTVVGANLFQGLTNAFLADTGMSAGGFIGGNYYTGVTNNVGGAAAANITKGSAGAHD